jgi:hypothetical protein
MPSTMTQESVTIPAETVVDVAAHLLNLQRILEMNNGLQETAASQELGDLAYRLLGPASGIPDGEESFWKHPLVVEAEARAEEITAASCTRWVEERERAQTVAARIRKLGEVYSMVEMFTEDAMIRRAREGHHDG